MHVNQKMTSNIEISLLCQKGRCLDNNGFNLIESLIIIYYVLYTI